MSITTTCGVYFVGLFFSVILVERTLDIHGFASALLGAMSARNFGTLQSCLLAYGMLTIIVNFAVDILYGFVSPKIRAMYG